MFGFGKKKSSDAVSIDSTSESGNFPIPSLPSGIHFVRTLRGHKGYVGRLAWSPDGRLLATPSNDRTVRVWNLESDRCLVLKGHEDTVHSVAFHPEGHILASTSNDRTVRIWDPQNGSLIRTEKSEQMMYGLAFDLDGKLLITAGEGIIHLRDSENGRRLKSLERKRTTAFIGHWVAFHPQDEVLACGAVSLLLIEMANGDLLRELDEHDGSPINSVAFSPQGDIVLTTSSDRTLKLCNPDDGRLLKTLEGHTGESYCAAFSHDGRVIASKGGDSIRLWNYQTGRCVTVPSANFGVWAPGLAFHPAKLLLAVVGSDPGVPKHDQRADSVIHLWSLDPHALFDNEGRTPQD